MNHLLWIIIAIIALYLLLPSKRTYEHMDSTNFLTDTDVEALQNLASMYNDGVLTVSSLQVTGDAGVSGNLSVSGDGSVRDLAVSGSGTFSGNITSSGKITADGMWIQVGNTAYGVLDSSALDSTSTVFG